MSNFIFGPTKFKSWFCKHVLAQTRAQYIRSFCLMKIREVMFARPESQSWFVKGLGKPVKNQQEEGGWVSSFHWSDHKYQVSQVSKVTCLFMETSWLGDHAHGVSQVIRLSKPVSLIFLFVPRSFRNFSRKTRCSSFFQLCYHSGLILLEANMYFPCATISPKIYKSRLSRSFSRAEHISTQCRIFFREIAFYFSLSWNKKQEKCADYGNNK